MKLNSIAVPISCWFTFALVQSVATMLGTPAALGGAVAVGLLFPAALQFFHVELKAVWRLLMATGASFAGIVPALVGKPSTSLGVAFFTRPGLCSGRECGIRPTRETRSLCALQSPLRAKCLLPMSPLLPRGLRS